MVSRRGSVIVAALTAATLPIAVLVAPSAIAKERLPGAVTGSLSGADPYLAPQGNGGYDVSDYSVTLAYDKKTHGIQSATAVITATSVHLLRQFSLDARAGLRIAEVRVGDKRATFAHRRDKLVVTEFGSIPAGKRFQVRVRYSGTPIPVRDRSGRGKFGWLRTRGGSVTYTEPTGTSTWIPSNDVFYDKATWHVTLSAPRGLLGVSTGSFRGSKDVGGRTVSRWRMDTPIQPYIQVVAFDRFQFSRRPIAGIPAFTAVAKGGGVSVEQMRNRTEQSVKWLQSRLGPFPFESTGAVVVSGADSAMETAGRPTYSAGSWNTSMATVLHEVAHQWFGNTLTATSASDIWLHEGFATYLENVETAQRTGRPLADIVHEQYVWDGWGARWRGQFDRVSLHKPTMRYLLNTTPYYRGQAALHALRLEVGDAKFWSILRSLAAGPAAGTTTTADVIEQAEAVSGRDLSAWADSWVYSVAVQRLPEAPTHEAVLQQVGPFIMDAASDYVWDPRGGALKQMRRAHKKWQPLDQLRVSKVTTMKKGRQTRYFVDFHTTVGVVYPKPYDSCFVFDKRNSQILSGSLLGVRTSTNFKPNRFTPRTCARVWN